MSYTTNPFVKWLLARSYGQGGAVALPNSKSLGTGNDGVTVPITRSPVGVQDVLDQLINQCASWPLPEGTDIGWCFLVGGPGNGKSEALRALAGALNIPLPPKILGEPALRSIPADWPESACQVVPGPEIVFINDASIPRPGTVGNKQSSSLYLDIIDGINRFLGEDTPTILFVNVNRGILVEEQAALQIAPSSSQSRVSDLAKDVIDWLVDPLALTTSPSSRNDGNRGIEILATPESVQPYYGQVRIPLRNQGAKYNIVVHAVFLDALSLLEPTPGVPGPAIDFSSNSIEIAPYQTIGGFSDRGTSRDQTIAGERLLSFLEDENWHGKHCVNPRDGTLCEAFSSCPFAQNARWLREPLLRQRFLDTLRATEIAAARRLTYRDMLGYFSLAVLGQPEREWLTGTHPCRWVESKLQIIASGRIGKKSAVADLASHRIYTNLFTLADVRELASARPLQGETLYRSIINRITLTGESPPSRAFEWALSQIDPARDFDPWQDRIRLRVLEAVESLEIVYPSDQVSRWPQLPVEVHSEIERALDQLLQGEMIDELGEPGKRSREATLRVQFLRKWRSILLLRQVGLALGQMTFRDVFVAWLAEQESALQNRELLDLGLGIQALILPPPGKSEFLLAPLRARTYNLSPDSLRNTVLVIIPAGDLRVWIVPRGDMLVAEIQISRPRERKPPELVASLVIDLPIAREALLHADGKKASFTEIGDSAFARIERVLASLVGRSLMRNPTPYFADEVGTLYRVTKNSAGKVPLRISPSERQG